MTTPLRIGLVAGEASGDYLGAALMDELRARVPQVQFVGLAGERMRAAGCETLGSSEELAVMGLVEPLRHLPRLWRLRSRLQDEFLARRVKVFIGIDSPAFNIGLAARLRSQGVATVQYVSPQVWAWRRGRVKKIAAAVDAVLCLLPFEPEVYAEVPVRAEFVGHPLADQIPLERDRGAARRNLGLPTEGVVVAVLPGSRQGEVARLGEDFIAAIQKLRAMVAAPVHVVTPLASDRIGVHFRQQLQRAAEHFNLFERRADEVLEAADVALVASGTATLQTMLHGVPMVVAYRFAPVTAFIARDLKLMKARYFALPNLLADAPLVPEFFQEQVRPEVLAGALRDALTDAVRRVELQQRFAQFHLQLRQGGAARAAQVVLDLAARLPGADQ